MLKAIASNLPVQTSQLPAGTVLQVVNSSLATLFSTNLSADQDTGLFVTITPTRSNSKILLILSTMLQATRDGSNNSFVYQKLWRGAIGSGTLIHDGFPIFGVATAPDNRGVGTLCVQDSPATTFAITYRVSINADYCDVASINSTTNPSTLTAIEVAS